MSSFDYASAIRARPSDADVPRAYGQFTYRAHPKTRGAVIPDPQWAGRNLVEVDLRQFDGFPGTAKKLWMHRKVAPVFAASMQDAEALGLLGKLNEYNGCYVPRHMGWTPGRPLSCHSWGIAVDFDASTNGYGTQLHNARINRDFVRLMEERGWTWGGRWTGAYCDAMHFQFTDPIPGTAVPAWQDAKLLTLPKPVPPAEPRRVILEGQVITEGRHVYGGVTVMIMGDGSAYLRPSTKAECDGKIEALAKPNGVSGRVTLLDQADTWVPFAGRAVYRGLMLNLDGATGDLWIRKARPEEL